ncbi:MAG: HD domain-containing protein [Candidatus Omnitrophica bacterium]|nr:HD domain-containing protein [Candidatus Omnitrophota bacterium]
MPRMFDMLRPKDKGKGFKAKEAPEKMPPKEKPLVFPKEILREGAEERKRKQEDHFLTTKKLISIVRKHGVDNQDTAKEIYESSLVTIRELLRKVRHDEDLNTYMGSIYSMLDSIFNQLLLGDNLLKHLYDEGEQEYYLPYHIVNTLILSSYIGIHAGFNKSKLKTLGLASLFCDVGLDTVKEVITQPRHLTDAERHMIMGHIYKSIEVTKKVDSIDNAVKEAIVTHHERINGSGYPRSLKDDDINPYARIIGLVDTYEAMTHIRPHREGMNAHKTMKFIIDIFRNYFDLNIVKLLIEKMSIYPIGSIVKLDTEELARVVGVRQGSPLRPVVMIVKDAFDKPVRERVIIDLSKQESPSITEPI